MSSGTRAGDTSPPLPVRGRIRYVPTKLQNPDLPPKFKRHASSVLTVGSPSTDRERLRNLGFPWTGDREAAAGSVQTVPVAAAAAIAVAKGAEAEHPEEPAGVLTCV